MGLNRYSVPAWSDASNAKWIVCQVCTSGFGYADRSRSTEHADHQEARLTMKSTVLQNREKRKITRGSCAQGGRGGSDLLIARQFPDLWHWVCRVASRDALSPASPEVFYFCSFHLSSFGIFASAWFYLLYKVAICFRVPLRGITITRDLPFLGNGAHLCSGKR